LEGHGRVFGSSAIALRKSAIMTLQFLSTDRVRHFVRGLVLSCLAPNLVFAQAKSGPSQPASSSCRIEHMDYKGWHAQQLSNRWVQLKRHGHHEFGRRRSSLLPGGGDQFTSLSAASRGELRSGDGTVPTRAGSEFHGVTDAGIVVRPLRATRLESGKVGLSGSFGVFFAGRLLAQCYDEHGLSLGSIPMATVDPVATVSVETEIAPPGKPARISLHLEDANGLDRGSLQEVQVGTGENR
jgi:hypothetical protein